jgi:membrane protease YdiL (CAAX protease family)
MKQREVLTQTLGFWAAAFLAIIVAFLVYQPAAKFVSVAVFLYLPLLAARRSGEEWAEDGVTLKRWKADLLNAGLLFLLVAPVYFLLWKGWALWTAPPHGPGGPPPGLAFHPRLPPDFPKWVVDQLFVVALPEEFFYRGWLQGRLERVWPNGHRVLGVVVGPAFLLTAGLFAVGHLAVFQASRLAVFFPALLFGWLRGRTGTIAGSTLFHAACNLYQLFLGWSFSPMWDGR